MPLSAIHAHEYPEQVFDSASSFCCHPRSAHRRGVPKEYRFSSEVTMKRSRRSPDTRLFNRGYQSGASGRSQDICPHEKPEHRANWMAGWRAGRGDRLSGMTGVAGLQLQPV
jgi:ribosome modulation factor